MQILRIIVKVLLFGSLLSLSWGMLFFVMSEGSISHGVQAALIMGLTCLVAAPLIALAFTRSQHVRLWVATGRIRRPTWRRALIVGALWGVAQSLIVLYAVQSVGRAVLVEMIWLSFFVVFPRLLWALFRDDIESRPAR